MTSCEKPCKAGKTANFLSSSNKLIKCHQEHVEYLRLPFVIFLISVWILYSFGMEVNWNFILQLNLEWRKLCFNSFSSIFRIRTSKANIKKLSKLLENNEWTLFARRRMRIKITAKISSSCSWVFLEKRPS